MYHSDVVQEYKGEGQRTKDEGRRKRGEEAKDEE
jgi:hypothetical protein